MSDTTDISRLYIPKAVQRPFTELVQAFRDGGAKALPPEYRKHVGDAFAGGTSIESGLVAIMIKHMHSDVCRGAEPPRAVAAPDSSEASAGSSDTPSEGSSST